MPEYKITLQQPRQFGAQVDFQLSPAVEDLTNLVTTDVDKTTDAEGRYIVGYNANQKTYSLKPDAIRTINFVIDGGYNTITSGSKGYLSLDFKGKITSWTIVSDVTGTISVDVKKTTYSSYPNTVSIAGTQKPSLTNAQKNKNINLIAWSSTLDAGDILEFVVENDSISIKKIMMSLSVQVLP
jgi:hypothetical protein